MAVPGGAYLHQQGVGGQILVEPLAAQGDGTADAGGLPFQGGLELQGQGEVILPSFVGQSGIAGAQHDHQLGAVRPIHQGVGAQLTSAAL